jgi:glycerol kinase
MVKASGQEFERLRVDGGATANDWLMQFQADILGVQVERPRNIETTAFGAAGLAGIAAGVWPDADRFLAAQHFTRFEARRPSEDAEQLRAGWGRAVRAALAWARDKDNDSTD